MNPEYTHLILVLDASFSMRDLAPETIRGVNDLILAQKSQPGTITTALYQFSTAVNEVANFQALTAQNYQPNGYTALLDAIGRAIVNEGHKLAEMPESERPGKVVLVIVTDGEENNSKQFSKAQIKDMIEHQQTVYSWQIVFLGANIDAFKEAGDLGISLRSAFQYDASPSGIQDLYVKTSAALTSYRCGASDLMDMSAHQEEARCLTSGSLAEHD